MSIRLRRQSGHATFNLVHSIKQTIKQSNKKIINLLPSPHYWSAVKRLEYHMASVLTVQLHTLYISLDVVQPFVRWLPLPLPYAKPRCIYVNKELCLVIARVT